MRFVLTQQWTTFWTLLAVSNIVTEQITTVHIYDIIGWTAIASSSFYWHWVW